MSFKRFFAGIFLLAFFVPCISYAQTTNATSYSPEYIDSLEKLLTLLEQELQILIADQSSSSAAHTSENSVPLNTPWVISNLSYEGQNPDDFLYVGNIDLNIASTTASLCSLENPDDCTTVQNRALPIVPSTLVSSSTDSGVYTVRFRNEVQEEGYNNGDSNETIFQIKLVNVNGDVQYRRFNVDFRGNVTALN